VKRQFQNLSPSHQPSQDRLRSEAAEPENQAAISDQSVTDQSLTTDCVNASFGTAERAQRERWIGFLARQIAIDILREAPVTEDGNHD
jgi:hypothetical protein